MLDAIPLVILALMVVLVAVCVEMRFRVAGIIREIRAEARTTGDHLTAALQRIDTLDVAMVQALQAFVSGHLTEAKATLKIASETPKPHRHQWKANSREETNRQQRVIHVCRVEGCRDTYVEVLDQDGNPIEAIADA